MVLNGTNRPREAALLLRRAIAISEQSADSANQNHLLSQLSNLAGVLQSSNQTNEAEKLYRRALKIAEEQLGPDDPKLATTLDNFATRLQQPGDSRKPSRCVGKRWRLKKRGQTQTILI
jgi:tetratricopeptide (TPR) repeat protein